MPEKKLPSINDREEDRKELLGWLKSRFDYSQKHNEKHHNKFKRLYELFRGKVDDYQDRGDEIEGEGKKELFRSMAISYMVRAGVGMINGIALRPYVTAEAEGFEELGDQATNFLKTWRENTEIQNEFAELLVDFCLCGTCIALNPWNPKAGSAGDPDLYRWPLRDCFPEPGVKLFKKMNIFQFRRTVDALDVKREYQEGIETRLESVKSGDTPTDGGSEFAIKKYVLYTAYYKDGEKWNQVVYSGDVVLEHRGSLGDSPFPYDDPPYYKALFGPDPGEFWGKGIGEDIEAVENILDKVFQQVIANQEDVGSSKIFVNKAKIAATDFEWDALSGVVIPTDGSNPSNVAYVLPATDTIGGAGAIIGLLRGLLVDITGIQAPAVGKRGKDVESGAAIRELQSGTNRVFAPAEEAWLRFMKQIYENSLSLMFKNYRPGRTFTQPSESGGVSFKILQQDFPRNFRPNFDIDLQDDSKLPRDPAGRAEIANRAMEVGAADPQYWREQMGIKDPALEQRMNTMIQAQQMVQQAQQVFQQSQQAVQQAEAQVKNLETQLQRSTAAVNEGRILVALEKAKSQLARMQANTGGDKVKTESAIKVFEANMKAVMAEMKSNHIENVTGIKDMMNAPNAGAV